MRLVGSTGYIHVNIIIDCINGEFFGLNFKTVGECFTKKKKNYRQRLVGLAIGNKSHLLQS